MNKLILIVILLAAISCKTLEIGTHQKELEIDQASYSDSQGLHSVQTFKIDQNNFIRVIRLNDLIKSISYIKNGSLVITEVDENSDGSLEIVNFHYGTGENEYVSFHRTDMGLLPLIENLNHRELGSDRNNLE